ncbi:MAG: methylamine dehydrogenase accessory protein MauD [Pseudomonadota bacterium]
MTITTALVASNLLLWVLVVALGLTVLALARQIGVLHERVAPAGALMVTGGPKVGEQLEPMFLTDITGREVRLAEASPSGQSTLVLFVSPTCPVCKTLLPAIKSAAAAERQWLAVVLASDGELAEQQRYVAAESLERFPYVLSTDLGIRFQVGKLPFVVLIDEQGVLRAKGLINSREHLESLFEAQERGVGSIQEFLERRTRGAA